MGTMHWDWGRPEPRATSEPPSTWLEELVLIRELLTDEEFRRLAAQYRSLRRWKRWP
jgi:hypothetical protein